MLGRDMRGVKVLLDLSETNHQDEIVPRNSTQRSLHMFLMDSCLETCLLKISSSTDLWMESCRWMAGDKMGEVGSDRPDSRTREHGVEFFFQGRKRDWLRVRCICVSLVDFIYNAITICSTRKLMDIWFFWWFSRVDMHSLVAFTY
jgi:hypothetical protein